MADQPPTTPTNDAPTLSVVASSPAPVSAPVSPAPAAAPVVAAPASEPVSPSAAIPPQSEAGATAASTEPKLPTDVPTLLEESTLEKPKGEEQKPGEDKKADGTKPDEPKAPEAPKLPPVEYKYELPETLKMDDATKGKLHEAFDAFRADPAVGPQKLIDLHNEVLNKTVEDIRKGQYDTFNATRKAWQDQVRADEELGGAGFETTMRAVARMRDMFVPPNRREAFNEALRVTGAGDHPEIIRMLHTAARFFDEPAMAPQNIKPPANIGKPPRGRGAADLYPNTTFSK